MIKTNSNSLSFNNDMSKVLDLVKNGSLSDALVDEFLKLENPLNYSPLGLGRSTISCHSP